MYFDDIFDDGKAALIFGMTGASMRPSHDHQNYFENDTKTSHKKIPKKDFLYTVSIANIPWVFVHYCYCETE